LKKTKIFLGIGLLLGLLMVIGLLTNSGIVKSASADYYGGCYYCKWNGAGYTCQCYDGAGGAFCHNNPCTLHFVCHPAI